MYNPAVAVLTEEESYGKALARGITGESDKIKIKHICTGNMTEEQIQLTACNLIKEGYVILTDHYMALETEMKRKTVFLVKTAMDAEDGRIPELSPVRDIFAKIKEIFFDEYGVEFYRFSQEKEIILGITGKTGGCGCTAVSVVLARWLSMLADLPVLYVNASERDDYGYYSYRNEEVRPKRQMLLHVADNIPWEIHNYCFWDKWGVFYFKPEKTVNCLTGEQWFQKVISAVLDKKKFPFIIIDGLPDNLSYICDKKINVVNSKDVRSAYYENKGACLTIWNRCCNKGTGQGEPQYAIPDDSESFIYGHEGIDIMMDGDFSAGIRQVAEDVIAKLL